MNTNSIATDQVIIHFDPIIALNEFVIAPLADRFGITGEEVAERFDAELILFNIAEYDSINGREGYRLRRDITEERLEAIIASSDLQA